MYRLSTCDEFGRNMSRVANTAHDDPSARQNTDPGDGRMVQTQTQPTLCRKLQSPTHKVSNDVRMADDQLMAVLFLGCVCPMKIFTESRFNASTVLEELLLMNKYFVRK